MPGLVTAQPNWEIPGKRSPLIPRCLDKKRTQNGAYEGVAIKQPHTLVSKSGSNTTHTPRTIKTTAIPAFTIHYHLFHVHHLPHTPVPPPRAHLGHLSHLTHFAHFSHLAHSPTSTFSTTPTSSTSTQTPPLSVSPKFPHVSPLPPPSQPFLTNTPSAPLSQRILTMSYTLTICVYKCKNIVSNRLRFSESKSLGVGTSRAARSQKLGLSTEPSQSQGLKELEPARAALMLRLQL